MDDEPMALTLGQKILSQAGYTVVVAQSGFDELDAPRGKRIVWFEQSGHWPHFEEPLKYEEQLLEILRPPPAPKE
ncbi:MAG: hypothetical protein M3429_10585 [Verrucomicrobiota bacterium]|nr:hypothetical protein [Verrucomicrobiota bacterium]